MRAQPQIPGLNDPGLVVLVLLLRFHGMGRIRSKFAIKVGPRRAALRT